MTHRIETKIAADGTRLEVEGLVDAAALAGICAAIRARRACRVVLKEGCQVEPAILEALGWLKGVDIVAESPFLARWLLKVRSGAY